ncbi:MAG: phytanoyl-CoA dioxygenase family protein, partial [Acidimicrobiales bacterium]|nr:phytanoyl-CoA dioxygenase family protein [Acidimicrobiales bacterium]
MQLPLLQGVADLWLKPHCEDYLLNTAQLIEIRPGETMQWLHRDEEAWPHMPQDRPQLEVEAMFALTDFTKANGATNVVPGSHLWEPEREAEPHEITQAEMPAGSALIYLGSTLHSGGANTTTD